MFLFFQLFKNVKNILSSGQTETGLRRSLPTPGLDSLTLAVNLNECLIKPASALYDMHHCDHTYGFHILLILPTDFVSL